MKKPYLRKILGGAAFLAGSWMMISPQSLMGVSQLKWMYRYAFGGELVLGIFGLALAYYLLDLKPNRKPGH